MYSYIPNLLSNTDQNAVCRTHNVASNGTVPNNQSQYMGFQLHTA